MARSRGGRGLDRPRPSSAKAEPGRSRPLSSRTCSAPTALVCRLSLHRSAIPQAPPPTPNALTASARPRPAPSGGPNEDARRGDNHPRARAVSRGEGRANGEGAELFTPPLARDLIEPSFPLLSALMHIFLLPGDFFFLLEARYASLSPSRTAIWRFSTMCCGVLSFVRV